MIKIWNKTYKNAFKYKREINKSIPGNRVKIKSIQLCKKLNLPYDSIKPTLDKLKKKEINYGLCLERAYSSGVDVHIGGFSVREYFE